MNNHIQLVLKSSTAEMSLNDHDSGIYIVPELEGLTGLPSIRTTSGVNSGYDGGWTSAQNFDARSITIRGVIANTDVATVERMRKQLIALLAQGKNEPLTLNLVTEAGNAYELEVRTIACDMAMQTVLQQQEFLIQLRADDPLIYDSSAGGESVLVQVQHAIGGFEINFELPLAISGGEGESIIENAGLEKVYPVISMYGALHNPTFVNATTNQQIQVNATLGFAEGDWHTPSDIYDGKVIYLEDAPANAPLASFRIDGETSQNGTPTPSAPVPVQTVTGENVVKICGKNLCSSAWESGQYSSATGAKTSTSGYRTADYIMVTPSQTYKVSRSGAGVAMNFNSYDNDHRFLSAITVSATGSFTAGENTRYITMYRGTSGGIENMMLEMGSSITAYEPYQGQSYEVNLGKNLLNSDGVVQITGQIQSDKTLNTSSGSTVYMLCRPNTTYVFSKTNTSRTRLGTAVNLLDSSHNLTNYVAGTSTTAGGRYYGVITSGPQDKYIYLTYSEYSDTTVETVHGQLEIGDGPSDYDSSAPIELCKIGDYQDYIYKSGEKWYVHKEVWKVALSSIASWGRSEDGKFFATSFASNYGVVAGDGYSDQFDYSGTAWSADYRFGVTGTGNLWIATGDSTITSTDLFNTWLQNHNPVAYFQLATPTDTEITNEVLIAQLEAVLAARTYAGINNITTITPNEQGTIELTYMTEKSDDRRDVIVIDSRMHTITLNGTDAYHLLAEGSEFPLLAPGENKLLLRSDTPGDNGYAEVNYKQGYLSI